MAAARALPGAAPMQTSRPPAADRAVKMTWRRLRLAMAWRLFIVASSGLRRARGPMDGATESGIGSAPADIGNIRVDIGVRWLGEGLQKRHHGHDLSRLAVAALRNTFLDPCALNRVAVVRRKALDRHDGSAIERADRYRTRPHCDAIYVHRTDTALGDPAAKLGS